MVTIITQDLLTSKINRPRTKCSVRKGIVIHYTGNFGKGATAKANRDYFERTTNYASTHFLVDDKQIIQAIPLWEAAWSVGAKSYTSLGKKLYNNGLPPNYTTVSIEMCVNSEADYEKVVENTVWLVTYLMKTLNLTINDIYRHYDITLKSCPLFYLTDDSWNKFLNKVSDGWNDLKRGESIVLDKAVLKSIELLDNLNIRKGPNSTYQTIKSIPKGTVVNVLESVNGWYRIDNGWINADTKYSKEVATNTDSAESIKNTPTMDLDFAQGVVKVDDYLNIRKGILNVDKDTSVVGTYKNGQIITIIQERAGWYNTDKGWISSSYVERIDERFNAILTNNANIRDVNLKVLCTGKIGDKIITSNKKQVINNIPVYACKYGNVKGYIQEGSFRKL